MEGENIDYSNEKISNANNKEIYTATIDDQKKRFMEVKNMQDTGTKGEQIIKELLKSSDTMDKRTLLSQNKIIKRLEIRHKYQIHIANCTLFNLAETFYLDIGLSKMLLNMRFDTICTILQNLNFLNYSKTIVFEETNGFITSAIASRSSGSVLSVFIKRPCQKLIGWFNLPENIKSNISYINIKELCSTCTLYEDEKIIKNEEINEINLKEETNEIDISNTNKLETSKNNYNYSSLTSKFLKYAFNLSFTNLVICAREEKYLPEILLSLYKFLKRGGVIVIYGRDKEVSLNSINFSI